MKSLKYLNQYLWTYRYRLLVGAIFVTLSNYFSIVPVEYIREVFDILTEQLRDLDVITDPKEKNSFFDRLSNEIIYYTVLLLAMALLRGIFLYFTRQTIIITSRLIEFDLKQEIYKHYQNLSMDFYKNHNTGDLMNRISEDVGKVRMYLGPGIMYALNVSSTLVLVLYKMISVNPTLTFYSLAMLPFLSFSIYYVSSKISKQSEKIQKNLSLLFNTAQESFAGVSTIKAFNAEESFTNEFQTRNQNYKKQSLKLTLIQSLFHPLMLLFIGMSTIFTFWVGGQMVIQNEDVTVGNIAEFIIYINLLAWPVTSLGWITSVVQRAEASQKRINQFLKTLPDISFKDGSQTEVKAQTCQFDKVSFHYPNTKVDILKEVSFSLKKGQPLAILGTTGSGKTTIAHLLTRMYDVSSGKITYDETPIQDYNCQSLRGVIGYVPQEVFLFSDTIRANIAFGSDVLEEDKIIQAAKEVSLYEEIQEFSEGFNTIVGERGIMLSGGQKQRVSIARALLKDPKILILDDCLSALDTRTESKILGVLEKKMSDRITVIISHRISSVKLAKEIIVLDNQKIVGQGTHEQLLAQNEIYQRLYEKQLKDK